MIKDLKDTMDHIDGLIEGLTAEHIVKKEQGHWGFGRRFHTEERGVPGSDEKEEWIIDKPAQKRPNISKRDESRRELSHLFHSCDYFSGRYKIGLAINADPKQLDHMIRGGLVGLQARLHAVLEPHEQSYRKPEEPCVLEYRCWDAQLARGAHSNDSDDFTGYCQDCEVLRDEYELDMARWRNDVLEWERSGGKRIVTDQPDLIARNTARADLELLYKLAEQYDLRGSISSILDIPVPEFFEDEMQRGTILGNPEYHAVFRSGKERKNRIDAAKVLGKSRWEILDNEFPKSACAIRIAAGVGIGFGMIYAVTQYLH
ncbi:MAG: hypothetical protein V1740_03630 [Candidatus Woesearchaeota archaeon]